MRRRLTQIAVVLVVMFAAAQLVRPSRTNPPTDRQSRRADVRRLHQLRHGARAVRREGPRGVHEGPRRRRTDPRRTIAAQAGTTGALVAVLDRSCGDCHSNATVWPWYTEVAPLSWLMARGVSEGRKAVNFSDWSSYSPGQQRTLLAASCDDASTGKMPGPWTLLHPEARLSPRDVETICAAAGGAR